MDSIDGIILCCYCGCPTNPQHGNACIKCFSSKLDASEGIRKLAYIYYCRFCDRYLEPPNRWIYYEYESKELLTCCLKKLTGLKNVNLVDAEFLPTDIHSKQLKIKLTVQKTLSNNSIAESIFNVDIKIIRQMCTDCHRIEAKDYWKAVVQLRQHVNHKKTFLYLEQIILKSNADKDWNNIKQHRDGLDFFFGCKQHANKFITFITKYVPLKWSVSEQLISHDTHSNTYNYKYSFSVEIVPICKHDVVCLQKIVARSYGLNNQLLICYKLNTLIHLIDPLTLKTINMDAKTYWKEPFYSVFSIKKASLFTVIEKEEFFYNGSGGGRNESSFTNNNNSQFKIAHVTLLRNSSWDTNDEIICKTHLGSIVQPGDTVECFDLTNTNINNESYDSLDNESRPEVIIVRKHYGDRSYKRQRQKWRLKQLDKVVIDGNDGSTDVDMDEFFKDIVDDKEMRQNIDIYAYRKLDDDDNDEQPTMDTNTLDFNTDNLILQKLDELHFDD